jgi:hypothetical protein
MSTIITKRQILREVREAAKAYGRVAGLAIDATDNQDLRLLVAAILRWEIVQAADASQVTGEAAHLARFEASNFADKLLTGMVKPIGIRQLARKLGVECPAPIDVPFPPATRPSKSARLGRRSADPIRSR